MQPLDALRDLRPWRDGSQWRQAPRWRLTHL